VIMGQLRADAQTPGLYPVGLFYTAEASLQVPPDLLMPGQWYSFTVRAIASDRARIPSPHRRSFPYAYAERVSALFSP
jgi:hypothetical protein